MLASDAIISDDGLYRYRLERALTESLCRVLAVLMVNPSTADAIVNDATIRRVMGFARRMGFGRVIVGNKFAFRATDIRDVNRLQPESAIGPDNDKHLEQICRDADFHIAAWGPLGKLRPHLRSRWQDVVRIADRVGCRLHCLGTAMDGHPRHPLMLRNDAPCSEWEVPWFLARTPAFGRPRCRDCADSDGWCCNDAKGLNCGFPVGHHMHRAEVFRPI